MRVFVKNMRSEALMPCSNKKARLLLKDGKAEIIQYNPFTIQLTYVAGETVQEVNVGVDTGAKFIGIAVTSGNKVLAKGEIELRDGITEDMTLRSGLRRNRRTRNLRYRQPRFLHRKRKEKWLPPSVQSKLNATFIWIDRFCSLVPHAKPHIEVGKFDIAKIINPEIEGTDYQEGNTKGYYDVRYFVFARDNYTCQVCKKKNRILNTHHIVYKEHGGTNRADNLIAVCTDCHTSENHKVGGILYNWMIKKKKTRQYKEPTFMNIVRKRTFQRYPEARITYGSDTTPKRKELELGKTHYNDAIAVSGIDEINENTNQYFYYKQFRKKKRSLHESIPRKGGKQKNTESKRNNKNVKFRNGIYLNDKVKYNDIIGWVYGFGGKTDAIVRDINGQFVKMPSRKVNIALDMKKAEVLCHNNGWQYTIRVG